MWMTIWTRRMPVDDARLVIRDMHQRHPRLFEETSVALYTDGGFLRLDCDSTSGGGRRCALEVAESLEAL